MAASAGPVSLSPRGISRKADVMTRRKYAADSLRMSLKRENDARDRRVAASESAVSRLKGANGSAPAGMRASIQNQDTSWKPSADVREPLARPAGDRATREQIAQTLREHRLHELARSPLLKAGLAERTSLNTAQLERAIAAVEPIRLGRGAKQPVPSSTFGAPDGEALTPRLPPEAERVRASPMIMLSCFADREHFCSGIASPPADA